MNGNHILTLKYQEHSHCFVDNSFCHENISFQVQSGHLALINQLIRASVPTYDY